MATPFVEIMLDKVYRIRFGMLATYKMEQKFGKSASEVDWNKEGISGFLKAATCAIVEHDFTELELAELIDDCSDQKTFMEIVSKAMEAGYGKNAVVTAKEKAKK
jgi:hypothetical protein